MRKRVGKSSKDFARLMTVTSEQYSRMENGAVAITPSNDKLARFLVITVSVVEAFKQPELMERVALNSGWSSVVGPDQRIIARVDLVQGGR